MYISVKLPSEFGYFNRLRKENYPFNKLFTAYLAAVSRLGIDLSMDVDELVGYIEDRIFEGTRLPDVPDGNEPVNFRYKTDDPDVMKYIGESSLTNRMAVMYIVRMTLRISAAYGTSLFRLMNLINTLRPSAETPKLPKKPVKVKEQVRQKSEPVPKQEEVAVTGTVTKSADEPAIPMPRVSNKAPIQEPASLPISETKPSSVKASAEAAKAAVSQLAELTAQVDAVTDENAGDMPIVETNPLLNEFL